MELLRKYGVSYTLRFPIIKRGAVDFAVSADWTPAAADTKISKDGGAFANTTNAPTALGQGFWSLTLTATEFQAGLIAVSIVDAAPKAIEDQGILIATYGHASALHRLDLNTDIPVNADGFVQANVEEWRSGIPAALTATLVQAYATGMPTTVAQQIADELLKRPISNVEPSAAFRTLYGAVCALVNRRRLTATALEVFKTDDAAVAGTLTTTTDAAQAPIKELDTV